MIEGQTALKRAEDTLIRYPRFRELHQDIKECQELSKIAGEPQYISLKGPTGAGKTTLIKDYARQFPLGYLNLDSDHALAITHNKVTWHD